MEHIRLSRTQQILVVTLARGKANALNAPMVAELAAALEAARDEEVRGLVLASASPKLFCAGFDVGEVFEYDPAVMRAFFGRFHDLLEGLRLLPKPVVAAVSGHAYAGGALLALACDFRIAADGTHFAVNEVNLGVVLPRRLIDAMVAATGPVAMHRVLMAGDVLTAEEAVRLGVAQEAVAPEHVLERSMARVMELSAKPPLAFAAHKRILAGPHGVASTPGERSAAIDEFMSSWVGPESVERRQMLKQSLQGR
jgi:enoyl-CoA hydratase/carnithine racemase